NISADCYETTDGDHGRIEIRRRHTVSDIDWLSGKENRKGLNIIREHQGIENSDHHVRDVSMNEDCSRIRKNPHIFSKLRSFALNIMRANKVGNIAQELFKNCMNIANLYNYQTVMKH
ncbi:hypothetical protein QUF90_19420, partial [Desulfococcaceae bacterium HSG9]|nr:hypothetical protein [Desulfococcaceae bacterium HSG9]